MLERCYRLFARHARKVLEELGQRMASFDVVEESLKWNPRADEDWRSAENLGIGVYDSVAAFHGFGVMSGGVIGDSSATLCGSAP